MKISVVTIVAGRHDHLRRQLTGIAASSVAPWEHVVISMNDPGVRSVCEQSGNDVTYRDFPWDGDALPLAQARNLGASIAIDSGADLLVFLDVDCVPAPETVARYGHAARKHADALLCGPVTYLPPTARDVPVGELGRLVDPHPARPNPPPHEVIPGLDYTLFWSLSFAVSPSTWMRLGGFCEQYVGYGGEDTDFAFVARSLGVGIVWVGGAHAFHQHHPVSSPPVEHLDEIIVNSRVFHSRWGSWPMAGWLDAFEARGLLFRDGSVITSAAPTSSQLASVVISSSVRR